MIKVQDIKTEVIEGTDSQETVVRSQLKLDTSRRLVTFSSFIDLIEEEKARQKEAIWRAIYGDIESALCQLEQAHLFHIANPVVRDHAEAEFQAIYKMLDLPGTE